MSVSLAGFPSKTAAIRDYQEKHPDLKPGEIMRALGLPYRDYFDAIRSGARPNPKRSKGGRKKRIVPPEVAVKYLPMLVGPGDRREDCRLYDACLTRAANLGGEAHCPKSCASFAQIPPDYYRALAMIPRESFDGYTLSLPRRGGGG